MAEKVLPIYQIILHVALELLVHLVAHLFSSIYKEETHHLEST
jgi:hypothetical protein